MELTATQLLDGLDGISNSQSAPEPVLEAVETNETPAEAVAPAASAEAEKPVVEKVEALEAVVADTFDYGKATNGLAKSREEFESLLQKANEADTLKAEVERIKANEIKFADDFERKRNDLKLANATKEQLQTWEKLHDLDIDKLDLHERVKLKMELSRKDLSKSEIEKYIDETFKLDENVYDEDERAKALLDYKIANKDDTSEFLKGQLANLEEIKPEKPVDTQELLNRSKNEVLPLLSPVLDAISNKISIDFIGDDGSKSGLFDFDVPSVQKQSIIDRVANVVAEYNLENPDKPVDLKSKEGVEYVNAWAKNIAIVENIESIATNIRNKAIEEYEQKIHNPTKIVQPTITQSNKGTAASDMMKILEDAGILK